ncbi:hypothetical protein FLA_6228 [Filimonas lacunae]|nr:hypothetical protein FLA_6228 [Filimonas lacunae]
MLLIAGFTSVVLMPSVSFSVPSYLLIFLGLPFFFLYSIRKGNFLHKELIAIAAIFLLINVLAQLYVYYSHLQLPVSLNFTDDSEGQKSLLRRSMFTQSLYLFAGFLIYLYVKHMGTRKHIHTFYWSLRILVAYGFLEILIFQITGTNGDFLSNRQFAHTSGSLFQVMQVGGWVTQRLKSLTGEPSMFALTVVPFWILAVGLKRRIDFVLFGIALVLSFSTSVWLGMGVLAIAFVAHEKRMQRYLLWMVPMGLMVIVVAYYTSTGFHQFLNDTLIHKLTGGNTSGQERSLFFKNQVAFWWNDLGFIGKLTGIGFGYVRSTDFFSTLLVNNGIIGVVLFTWFFFKHSFVRLKGNKDERYYYRTALIATYLIMMVSVPEFAYLSIWILLAYPDAVRREYL